MSGVSALLFENTVLKVVYSLVWLYVFYRMYQIVVYRTQKNSAKRLAYSFEMQIDRMHLTIILYCIDTVAITIFVWSTQFQSRRQTHP